MGEDNKLNWSPRYIKTKVNDKPNQSIDANYWNRLWNLVITQGDNNTEGINQLIQYLEGLGVSVREDVVQYMKESLQENINTLITNFDKSLDTASVKKRLYPQLSSAQKNKIYNLCEEWYRNRNLFYYRFEDRRCNHSGNTYDSTKKRYALCCNTFVQMIMMGRSVSDYIGKGADETLDKITKYHDFGYYAEFKYRQMLCGAAFRDSSGNITGYHGFYKPNPNSNVGSYSRTTYYDKDSNRLNQQYFIPFDAANDLARELEELGCRIPVSELDTGDIIFIYDPVPDTAGDSMFNYVAWEHIKHVAIVSYKNPNTSDLTIIDCTAPSSASGSEDCILKSGLSSAFGEADRARASEMLHHCICYRMPIAFGIPSNVPSCITPIETPYEM